jgi:flagellar motor protein MotB
MTFKLGSNSRVALRLTAVLVVAAGASACSSIPDWADPTGWFGGGDTQASSTPDDQPVTADNGQLPDLSTIPGKPAAPSTPDEQKNVSDTLAADRTGAQYSSDALKGGTEAAAAPPPAAPPPSAAEDVADNNSSPASPPAAPTPQPAAEQPATAAQNPSGAAPGTLPDSNPPPASSADAAAPATQVAMAETPPPAAAPSGPPAVPAVSAAAASAATAVPQMASDNALGFRPSAAPPLDASVAQFVPQPILSRYQQTAAIGPAAAVSTTGPSAYTSAVSGSPTAVVFFPNDTTILSAAAKAQVVAAAKTFRAGGGQGYIRVVGHASSSAEKMSHGRDLVSNFERSQARANAVARELIRDGVPAARVLVEAVGDTQPYSESVPQGEDGNRRADIFIQG